MVREDSAIRINQMQADRDRILRLVTLQKQLRSAVLQRMKKLGLTREDLSTAARVRRYSILEFLDGNKVSIGQKFLCALAVFLEEDDLTNEILNTVRGHEKNPALALAIYPEETIILLFAIIEASYTSAETRWEIFAKAFGEHQDVIMGALKYKHDALTELVRPEVAQSIMDVLTSGTLQTEVLRLHEEALQEYREARKVLEQLMVLVIEKHGGITRASEALGIHKSKYPKIMQEPPILRQYGLGDVLSLTELCRKHLQVSGIKTSVPNTKPDEPPVTKRILLPIHGQNVEAIKTLNVDSPEKSGDRHSDNPHTPLNPQAYSLLNGLLKSLRGTLQSLKAIKEGRLVEFRSQDRLELARALVGLLELDVISKGILSEALHGKPIENFEELGMILGLFGPSNKGKEGR